MSRECPPDALISDPMVLRSAVSGMPRVVFDLDGTLYDTRDFERPALQSVAAWLRASSGLSLPGLAENLWTRRELDRHRPGLFDELLLEYGLPSSWGVECARQFHAYPGSELQHSESLRSCLSGLLSSGSRLALVSNGYSELQHRKLKALGLGEMFDLCVFCDPRSPQQLKPSDWAWVQLGGWRQNLPTVYVGDDPVDAQFAVAGGARFLPFKFRSGRYDH